MGKNKAFGLPAGQAELCMLGFASAVMRSATAVLVAVTVRSRNVFSVCDSENGFHKQPVRWAVPL